MALSVPGMALLDVLLEYERRSIVIRTCTETFQVREITVNESIF